MLPTCAPHHPCVEEPSLLYPQSLGTQEGLGHPEGDPSRDRDGEGAAQRQLEQAWHSSSGPGPSSATWLRNTGRVTQQFPKRGGNRHQGENLRSIITHSAPEWKLAYPHLMAVDTKYGPTLQWGILPSRKEVQLHRDKSSTHVVQVYGGSGTQWASSLLCFSRGV